MFQGVRGTNLTAEKLCDVMTDETRGDTIQRYADVNSMILDTYEEQCLNLRYVKLLTTLNQTSWDSESADGRTYTCVPFSIEKRCLKRLIASIQEW